MKTAIELVLENHDTEFDKMEFLRWLSRNRKLLLETEKAQIEAAFMDGQENYNIDSQDTITAEEYYNQTYEKI